MNQKKINLITKGREKKREKVAYIFVEQGWYNVFAEWLESPYYGSIVWECLKNLEIKVNEICELSSATNKTQTRERYGRKHKYSGYW